MTSPLILIAGPCVIESRSFAIDVAKELKSQLSGLPIEFYFKASYDKANRSSGKSFRGPGMLEGLKVLGDIRESLKVPTLTDFHETADAEAVSEVVDVLQVPAFLCRQTDLVLKAAEVCLKMNRKLNIKKGQFLAPWDAKNIVTKVQSVLQEGSSTRALSDFLWMTERGVSFGYNRLVVDMISFQILKGLGARAIYDATHSIQLPGAAPGGEATGGERKYLETLSRAAVAAGAEGVFMEVHPDPASAKSDGPNAFPLHRVRGFVEQLVRIYQLAGSLPPVLQREDLS